MLLISERKKLSELKSALIHEQEFLKRNNPTDDQLCAHLSQILRDRFQYFIDRIPVSKVDFQSCWSKKEELVESLTEYSRGESSCSTDKLTDLMELQYIMSDDIIDANADFDKAQNLVYRKPNEANKKKLQEKKEKLLSGS